MALFSKDAPQQPAARPQPSRGSDAQPSFNGTYLGANVTIDGTVSGSEAVLIEGTVRGKINLTNELRVGAKARVEATVHAKNVTVEGRVTGDISADDRVELVASASADGNIKAPKI